MSKNVWLCLLLSRKFSYFPTFLMPPAPKMLHKFKFVFKVILKITTKSYGFLAWNNYTIQHSTFSKKVLDYLQAFQRKQFVYKILVYESMELQVSVENYFLPASKSLIILSCGKFSFQYIILSDEKALIESCDPSKNNSICVYW